MIKSYIFFILFWGVALSSKELTLDFFKDKPRSIAKDFYISQYLDQNISSDDALSLIGEVDNLTNKLFYKFADKIDDFGFKRVKYCKTLQPKKYVGKSADCIALGLSLYKATKLDKNELKTISQTINYKYPILANRYKIISTKSFERLEQSKPLDFITIFTTVGKNFRDNYYNYPIKPNILNKLSNYKSFGLVVKKIVRDLKLKNLQKSILKFDSSKLDSCANFLLAINAIRYNKTDIALWYLKLSQKKAKTRYQKDKAIFWQYLLTKKRELLMSLIKSKDINIYTLYAYQISLTNLPMLITSIEPKQKKAPFNIEDPFEWIKLKKAFKNKDFNSYEEKKEEILKLNSKESEAYVAKLLYDYKINRYLFLTPFSDYLQKYRKQRVALLLAIARQESRFIPTAISKSYALGMMQFMPYVAKSIAKKYKIKDFQYEDLFNPKIAYAFANIHLDYLEAKLHNPLLIAYAYNAGLGYTKREILQQSNYFNEKNRYEPFLTMELINNKQAREYGKKVLTNYIIYAKILNLKDITIIKLLKNLKQLHHNQNF